MYIYNIKKTNQPIQMPSSFTTQYVREGEYLPIHGNLHRIILIKADTDTIITRDQDTRRLHEYPFNDVVSVVSQRKFFIDMYSTFALKDKQWKIISCYYCKNIVHFDLLSVDGCYAATIKITELLGIFGNNIHGSRSAYIQKVMYAYNIQNQKVSPSLINQNKAAFV